MSKVHDKAVPVVLLKAGRHGGLGIVRSLGRMGVPVYVVDRSRWAPASASSYASGSFEWDVESAPEAESVEFLIGLARRLGSRPVLLPTSDYAAMFVARQADHLAGSYRFSRPPEGQVRRLFNKKEMHFLACATGIPVPRAAFPQSLDEVRSFSRTASFPLMLKGIDGRLLEKSSGSRMFLVRTEDELLRLYRLHEHPTLPNLFVQEYIPGDDGTVWMFNGYFDRSSRCPAGGTGAKLRQYPEATGLTTLGECLHNEEVCRLSCDFARTIGYQGLLDIDYRYDARDRQYKILDVNPRVGATFRLFADLCGLDIVRAAYLDLIGAPIARFCPTEGRRWVVEDLDAMAAGRAWWAGRMSVRQWIASYRGVQERAVLAADDPVPVLAAVAIDALAAGRQISKQMKRGLLWNEAA